MRAVVDTNVFVSGILSAAGPPARVVEMVLSGEVEPAFDAQIRAEYEEVLGRRELALNRRRLEAVLDVIDALGLEVSVPPWPDRLPDPDDSPFLAVAAWVGCPLVTGNLRHFPVDSRAGVIVLTPRQLVDQMARKP
jgi:predicted nucleic acid-binding protein